MFKKKTQLFTMQIDGGNFLKENFIFILMFSKTISSYPSKCTYHQIYDANTSIGKV